MIESPARTMVKSDDSDGRGCAGSVGVAAVATTAATTRAASGRRRMLKAEHERRLQRTRRLLVPHLQIIGDVERLVRAVVVVLSEVAGVEQIEHVGGQLRAPRPAEPDGLADL